MILQMFDGHQYLFIKLTTIAKQIGMQLNRKIILDNYCYLLDKSNLSYLKYATKYITTTITTNQYGELLCIYDDIFTPDVSIGFITVCGFNFNDKSFHAKSIIPIYEINRKTCQQDKAHLTRFYGGYNMCIIDNRWIVIGSRFDLSELIVVDIIVKNVHVFNCKTSEKNTRLRDYMLIGGTSDFIGLNNNQFLMCSSDGIHFYHCQIFPENNEFDVIKFRKIKFPENECFDRKCFSKSRTIMNCNNFGELCIINNCNDTYSDSDSDSNSDSDSEQINSNLPNKKRHCIAVNHTSSGNWCVTFFGICNITKKIYHRGTYCETLLYECMCKDTNLVVSTDCEVVPIPIKIKFKN